MEENNKYEETKLFGIDIVKLYGCNLDKSYDLILNNTDYLNNISKDEVKQIEFSYYKDIIILLKNGIVLINGIEKIDSVIKLVFLNATDIFAINKHKMIIPLISNNIMAKYINNNFYKYKKIIFTPLNIVALTYEGDIKTIIEGNAVGIDYTRFTSIDDIGYNEEDDQVVIIKDKEIKPLFIFIEDKLYEKSQVVLDGEKESSYINYYII